MCYGNKKIYISSSLRIHGERHATVDAYAYNVERCKCQKKKKISKRICILFFYHDPCFFPPANIRPIIREKLCNLIAANIWHLIMLWKNY